MFELLPGETAVEVDTSGVVDVGTRSGADLWREKPGAVAKAEVLTLRKLLGRTAAHPATPTGPTAVAGRPANTTSTPAASTTTTSNTSPDGKSAKTATAPPSGPPPHGKTYLHKPVRFTPKRR